MKLVALLFPLLAALILLAGCASAGRVYDASPLDARHLDLAVILVRTTSSRDDLAVEKQMLNDRIVSALRETGLFQGVSANRVDLGENPGIVVSADIEAIRKVSKETRLWAGAMARRAWIRVRVTVSDLNSGRTIQTFMAEGESSGGSALAGTTDEAIDRVAVRVAGEVQRINSLTAQ